MHWIYGSSFYNRPTVLSPGLLLNTLCGRENLGYLLNQPSGTEGFCHIHIRPHLVPPLAVELLAFGRENNNRYMSTIRIVLDSLAHFKSIDPRLQNIKNDQIYLIAGDGVERFFPRVGFQHSKSLFPQVERNDLNDVSRIVQNEN